MSKRIQTERLAIVIIEEEKPQQCDLCGKVDELRPYGPGGACICFDCGQKAPAETERRMGRILFGDKP